MKQVRNQDSGNGVPASQAQSYPHSEAESCDWNEPLVAKVQEPLKTF